MVALSSENTDSHLRAVLKAIKTQYDNPSLLRRYEQVLRRILFLERDHEDATGHGEALHQLAILRANEGDIDGAEKLLIESMSKIAEHEHLTLARSMRQYGLLIAMHRDPKAGLYFIEQALAHHDDDFKSHKGLRQRRITKSYEWRARLLVDEDNATARGTLIAYALSGCRDCCKRDQHEAIDAALVYADGVQKQLLDARLIEIYARRYKPISAVTSMAKFVIDVELSIASKVFRTIIWKE